MFWELKTCCGEWHSRRPHSHAEWSLGLVESGSCALTCEGRTMTVQAPALVWFSPETVHECRPTRSAEWSFHMLYWKAPGAKGQWGTRPLGNGDRQTWKTFFDALADGDVTTFPLGPILQEFETTSPIFGPDGASRQRLWLRRPDRPYKKLHGLTPTQHRTVLRLRRAQELLREGKPPAEAGLEAGFYDQSQFTRSFRTFTGTTPGKYLNA